MVELCVDRVPGRGVLTIIRRRILFIRNENDRYNAPSRHVPSRCGDAVQTTGGHGCSCQCEGRKQDPVEALQGYCWSIICHCLTQWRIL